jgi:DNA modification methylase
VFKKGKAAHIDNIALGRSGRHRGDVRDHSGQDTLTNGGKSKLSLHPAVKPVALIAAAMRDGSNPNGLVLDPFGGTGTTLMAAEKTGRRARLIEIEPRLVDCAVRRWQRLTGNAAVHGETNQPFGATEGPKTNNNEAGPRDDAPSMMGADHER